MIKNLGVVLMLQLMFYLLQIRTCVFLNIPVCAVLSVHACLSIIMHHALFFPLA